MADYSYITNNATFRPFTFQEMLTPFLMYKDTFEKMENSYEELAKADDFKYLDETLPEDSKARKRYDNFAKDLNSAASDLAQNGLNMGNRRALTSLRKRYIGEIGSLNKASAALEEEKKFRKTLSAQDPSMLYATDSSNLNIDDFLDGKSPNAYNVSGNDLYAKAAASAKGISSRLFKTEDGRRILNNYYIDYVQKRGFTQEDMDAFYKDASKIPALKNALDDIMDSTGANDNLTGNTKRRAYKYALRGIMDNAIYEEQHSPQRDLGKMTAAEAANYDIQKRQLDLEERKFDFQKNLEAAKVLATSNKSNMVLPGYTDIEYISRGGKGAAKKVDEVPDTARRVRIEVQAGQDGKNPKYIAYAGTLKLGEISGDGKVTNYAKDTEEFKDAFAEAFKGTMSWWDPSSTYDHKYDSVNIEALLKDVYNTAKKTGSQSYNNFEWYLEPDNASWNNQAGGFYRVPLSQVKPTIFNEDTSNYDKIADQESNAKPK